MSHNLCNLNTLPYEKMDFLTIDIGHLRGSGNELQKPDKKENTEHKEGDGHEHKEGDGHTH